MNNNKLKSGDVVEVVKDVYFSDGTYHEKGGILVIDEHTVFYFNSTSNKPYYQAQ